MKSRDDDVTMRWWVIAHYNDQYTGEPKESMYTDTHEEALQLFEQFSRSYRCVWLAEFGRYKTSDKFVDDWVWYKWTKDCDWGDPVGRFSGWPEDDLDLWVPSYTAIYRWGRRVEGT